jgi:uncharacterized membrane protein
MTAPALICWGAHPGPPTAWLGLGGTPLAFLANPISLVIFTLLAIGEFIGDKLPKTPSRITLFPLAARAGSGALCGSALAVAASVPVAGGAVCGLVGAIVGAYAGYSVRRLLTSRAGLPDLLIALVEDAVAIGGGLLVVSRF